MNCVTNAGCGDVTVSVGCGCSDERLVDGGRENEFESSRVSRRGECARYLEHACHSYGIRIGDRDDTGAAGSGGCRGCCYCLCALQVLDEVDQVWRLIVCELEVLRDACCD